MARAKKKPDRQAASIAFDKAVGARIHARRGQYVMTMEELAGKVGRSIGTVSRWENGISTCEPFMLAKIASALKCKPSDFIDGIKV